MYRPALAVMAAAFVLVAGCGSVTAHEQSASTDTGSTGTGSTGAGTSNTEPASVGTSSARTDGVDTSSAGIGSVEPSSVEETGTSFPMTTDNCGVSVALDAPPQRILAIRSTAFELLLALGVGDRIVGKAYIDGEVPAEWTTVADQIPLVADTAPSQEPVLELDPDLIVAGWESNFAADTAGTRQSLADKAIATYVSPSACSGDYQPTKLTYPGLFDEFTELGDLLGVPEAAAELVKKQTAQLDTVIAATPGTTALWWSSSRDTPYVGAGIGEPQMVMDAVGLDNIAADIPQTWVSMGWESIIAADPEVIVLVSSSGNTAEQKKDYLESNPATARLDAVIHQRYLKLPFAAAEAGVRSASAAVDIGQQLRNLGYASP